MQSSHWNLLGGILMLITPIMANLLDGATAQLVAAAAMAGAYWSITMSMKAREADTGNC